MSDSPPPTPPLTDDDRMRRFELLISVLLRTGVSISLAMIVTGSVLTFVHHPSYLSSKTDLPHLTGAESAFPHSMRDALAGLSRFEGRSFVITGLLVLIATPVMRVAVSIFGFLAQRDGIFVAITSAVLTLLLLSFVLGRVEG